jgi:hypothetical protein
VVEEGDCVIVVPGPTRLEWDVSRYQTHDALVPSEPPVTVSVTDVPEQSVPVLEAVTPVGAVEEVQARHWFPLHEPDSQAIAPCVAHEPFEQVPWSVNLPPEQEGPAPHLVVDDLFIALHTGLPVEQSVAPVWHSVLTPSVHEAPELQALQVPVASHTPPAEPAMQDVAMLTRLQVPVEHEWHVPQVVAQQIPETQ